MSNPDLVQHIVEQASQAGEVTAKKMFGDYCLYCNGKTFGYVYVLQGETKQVPNGFHWDVTDQRHMLNVAPILEEQTELSVELLKTLLQ